MSLGTLPSFGSVFSTRTHVAFVRATSNGCSFTCYVNGFFASSYGAPQGCTAYAYSYYDSPFVHGYDYRGASYASPQYWAGGMSQVALYTAALTPAQISALIPTYTPSAAPAYPTRAPVLPASASSTSYTSSSTSSAYVGGVIFVIIFMSTGAMVGLVVLGLYCTKWKKQCPPCDQCCEWTRNGNPTYPTDGDNDACCPCGGSGGGREEVATLEPMESTRSRSIPRSRTRHRNATSQRDM